MLMIWENVSYFGLLFVRVASFIGMLPVLGNRSVPAIAKIGLAGFLALFLLAVQPINQPVPPSLWHFGLLAVKEAVIGLGLGFLTKMLFAGIQMAGEVVGRQVGFAMARTFDPTFQTQSSVISEFYLILMMLIYLTLSGHHFLISGLAESYRFLPVSAPLSTAGIEVPVMKMAGGIFLSCIKIAAPVLVTLMLTNIALGLLARTVPQMNVFMVGLPLRLGLGVLAMIITIELFVHIFQVEWTQFERGFSSMLRLLGGM